MIERARRKPAKRKPEPPIVLNVGRFVQREISKEEVLAALNAAKRTLYKLGRGT
ncbi:MAG TPA: hypothetical protein VI384_04450 [Candidatus Dormibacteraeota bacterium]